MSYHDTRADVLADLAVAAMMTGDTEGAFYYAEQRVMAQSDARDHRATLLDLRVAS